MSSTRRNIRSAALDSEMINKEAVEAQMRHDISDMLVPDDDLPRPVSTKRRDRLTKKTTKKRR